MDPTLDLTFLPLLDLTDGWASVISFQLLQRARRRFTKLRIHS